MADNAAQPDSCSVCGRTILAGERTREYVTRDGDRIAVCDLCRTRAEGAGWIPAELAATALPDSDRDGRGRGRVRRLLERARESAAAVSSSAGAGASASEGRVAAPEPETAQREQRQPPLRPRVAVRREQGTSERPPQSRPRSIPQSPRRRIARAFDRFNVTEYRRTVAGLMRSLGRPRVSAVTTAETPAEVRITVAWELSWYQWEVDLAGDGLAVRELAKGDELGQLDEVDMDWNARATDDGELRLGLEETPTEH